VKRLDIQPRKLVRLLGATLLAYLSLLISLSVAPGLLLPEIGVAAALWLRRGFSGLVTFGLGTALVLVATPLDVTLTAERLAALGSGAVLVAALFASQRRSGLWATEHPGHVLLRLAAAALGAALVGAAAGMPDILAGLRDAAAPALPASAVPGLWILFTASAWLTGPPLIWLLQDRSLPESRLVAGLAIAVLFAATLIFHNALLPQPFTPAQTLFGVAASALLVLWLSARPRPRYTAIGLGVPVFTLAALLAATRGDDGLLAAASLSVASAVAGIAWMSIAGARAQSDTQQELRSSRYLFDTIMRFLPVGIVHTDVAGQVRYTNATVRALLESSEHVQDVLSRLDPAQQARLQEAWQRFTTGHGAFNEDVVVHHRGQARWLNVRVEKAYQDGTPQGYIGTLTDITTEKRHEEARYRSEAQSRAVLDNAVDAIVTITRDGDILTFNRSAQRIFQYRADEMIGRNVRLLMPEPYRSQHDQYMQRYLQHGEAKIIGIGRELVGQRKDGSVFPIYLAVSEVIIDDTVTFTGIVRDIRREKAAQEEIRRQNEQLHVTLQNAPLGMVTYRFGQPFASINRAFENMLGYPHAELIAMTFESLVHPDDRAELQRLIRETRTNRLQQFSLHLRLCRHDGDTVHVIAHNAVTHDEFGHPDTIIAQIEDMSAQIEAEEAAVRQQEKLTHVARLSTLGEMTAGIAHEINQPLTAIAMYARTGVRLLDAGIPDPGRFRDLLEKLNAQSLRAGEVIDRIQALVRNRDSERMPVDLNRLVQDIRRLAESDARVNDVQLVLELGPDLPPIMADQVQLQQVLLNLIRNAIDSMVDIGCCHGNELRIQTLANESGQIEARVIDQGSGVADSFSAQLFTPFATTKETGMGMGLSICKSIIHDHGGTLGFRNNPGFGATFYFQLPTDAGHEEQ
jgi:two-component system, LuxR family, sensor kinase FixL